MPFVALATIAALAACTPPATSTLLDPDCQAPCWHGIEPGATTTDDALELISQIPGVYRESIAVRPAGEGNTNVSWVMQSGVHDYYGEVAASEGTVSGIALTSDGDVTLRDLLFVYGEPDTAGGFIGQGHGRWRRVFLLYNDGVAAVLGDKGSLFADTWSLKPRNRLIYLYFYQPNHLHDLIRTDPAFTPLAPDFDSLIAASIPWEGYSTLTLHLVP